MTDPAQSGAERGGQLPPEKVANYLLQECRMVLPGIQTLFGFQLVAVFNTAFSEKLSPTEQRLHYVALGLGATAAALIMTPAAYHRQTGARQITETFVALSTRLLLWSMLPLALSVCLDFYLIGQALHLGVVAQVATAALFGVLAFLWFVLPRVRAVQRALAGSRPDARGG